MGEHYPPFYRLSPILGCWIKEWYKALAWVACSRCGRTKALYRGAKISFVRHVNNRVMKYNIPLALLVAVRTLAEGVNAEFTVMPRSLICSQTCCFPL